MPRASELLSEQRPVDLDADEATLEEEQAGGPLASPSHAAFCFSTLLHHFDGGSAAAPSPDFDHDGHHW